MFRIVYAVAIVDVAAFVLVHFLAEHESGPDFLRSIIGMIVAPGVIIAERVLRGGINAGPGFLAVVFVSTFAVYCSAGLLLLFLVSRSIHAFRKP